MGKYQGFWNFCYWYWYILIETVWQFNSISIYPLLRAIVPTFPLFSASRYFGTQVTIAPNPNDYGTLRPGDIEASDIEATTLRPGDIEARRHWGQATLRPGDIEARRRWGQICMSNSPKPKHWPRCRDIEANVWPQSRDDVEARRRWGQTTLRPDMYG